MPFTLAHAAAAFPFRRTRLVLSALVAGCFAPDFEYFLRFAPRGSFGHTFPGLFVLDVPLAIIVLWLFHAYMKEPLLILLPNSVRERLRPTTNIFRPWSPARLALIGISILIGATTHILWDSFTHPTFWPYQHWVFLRRTLPLPLVGDIPFYKLFQQGSTLLGIAILLLWLAHWYRSAIPMQRQVHVPGSLEQRRLIAALLVCVALIGAAIRAFVGTGFPANFRSFEIFIGLAVVTAITLLWLQWLIYGVTITISSSLTRPPESLAPH